MNVVKTKTASKPFAVTTSSHRQTSFSIAKPKIYSQSVPRAQKITHFGNAWLSEKKTPTERAKLVTQTKLYFSVIRPVHSLRQYPQPRKCTKEGCGSTHNTFLHDRKKSSRSNHSPGTKQTLKHLTALGSLLPVDNQLKAQFYLPWLTSKAW